MAEDHSLLSTHAATDHVTALRAELSLLRDELEHAQRLATIGVVAAGIAHEINNILTPVLAYSQLAMANPQDDSLKAKAIERTIQGVQMVTQVAEAMLGFASTPQQPDAANILETVHATINCLARDPAKDRVTVTLRIPPQLNVQIRPLALQQVLMNLVINAIEAMKPAGGSITISAKEVRDGSTSLEISDNGPGIPADVAKRLFEPFAHGPKVAGRINSSRSTHEGTGLGLAICRRLIEDARGTISANSMPGHGTTFQIILPTSRQARAKAG